MPTEPNIHRVDRNEAGSEQHDLRSAQIDLVFGTKFDITFCLRLAQENLADQRSVIVVIDGLTDAIVHDDGLSNGVLPGTHEASVTPGKVYCVSEQFGLLMRHDRLRLVDVNKAEKGSYSPSMTGKNWSMAFEGSAQASVNQAWCLRNIISLKFGIGYESLLNFGKTNYETLWVECPKQSKELADHLPSLVEITKREQLLALSSADQSSASPTLESEETEPQQHEHALLISQSMVDPISDQANDQVQSWQGARFTERLSQHAGFDCSQYSAGTIAAHIEKRSHAINMLRDRDFIADAKEYAAFCENNPDEYASFVRDGLGCKLLKPGANPFIDSLMSFHSLIGAHSRIFGWEAYEEPKVWVVGCGYGEEAYALAVAINQTMHFGSANRRFKLFATDIHSTAVQVASRAFYSDSASIAAAQLPFDLQAQLVAASVRSTESILELCLGALPSLGSERLSFWTTPKVRSSMVFSEHNIFNDPPLKKLNMIVFKNTLSLFNQSTKRKIIQIFNASLVDGGVLLLGDKDFADLSASGFKKIDSNLPMYTKVRAVGIPQQGQSDDSKIRAHGVPPLKSILKHHRRYNRYGDYKLVIDKLVDEYFPPGLLVSADLDLLHVFGEVALFTRGFSSRVFKYSLPDILTLELRPIALKLLGQLEDSRKTFVRRDANVRTEDETVSVTIQAHRFVQAGDGDVMYGVFFLDNRPSDHEVGSVKSNLESTTQDHAHEAGVIEEDYLHLIRQSAAILEDKNVKIQQLEQELNTMQEALEQACSLNDKLVDANEYFFQKTTTDSELRQLELLPDHLVFGLALIDENLSLTYFNEAMTHFWPSISDAANVPIQNASKHTPYDKFVTDLSQVIHQRIPLQRSINEEDLILMQPFHQKQVLVTVIGGGAASPSSELLNGSVSEDS